MADQQKRYTVVSDFNDASGKQWKAGQQYTGQDAQQQLQQGTVREDTSQSGQGGQSGQSGQQGQSQR